MGAALAERLKQPVVIENIAGGGGNIGADRAAKSPADGYTLYIGNNATVGLNTLVYKSLTFNPLKDLAPVSLVALAKAKPGTLNFGSTGAGGLSQLVGELLKSSTGTQMAHIACKGTGPATNDLLGGRIQRAVSAG